MPQPCRVCTAEDRPDLERRIVAGEPIARLARESGISRRAITRHRDEHLAEELARAHRASEDARHVDLLEELELVHRTGMALLRAAVTGTLAVPTDAEGTVKWRHVIPLTDADTGEWLDGPEGPRFAHPQVAARALREVRGTLELLARIEGDLEPEGGVLTVVFDDDWTTGA